MKNLIYRVDLFFSTFQHRALFPFFKISLLFCFSSFIKLSQGVREEKKTFFLASCDFVFSPLRTESFSFDLHLSFNEVVLLFCYSRCLLKKNYVMEMYEKRSTNKKARAKYIVSCKFSCANGQRCKRALCVFIQYLLIRNRRAQTDGRQHTKRYLLKRPISVSFFSVL